MMIRCTRMHALARIFFVLVVHCRAIAAESESIDRFILQNIGFPAEYDSSFDQVRTRMHVQREQSQQVPNKHVPNQVDRIVTLADGNGLEVQVYVTAPGRVLIQRVAMTTSQFRLPFGLQLSRSSLADVRKFFGESGKSERAPNGMQALRFFPSGPIGLEVSVLLWFDSKAVLAGLEWHYEID